MNIEEIMGLENNKQLKGTFIISDINQKPFKEKEGNFLTFYLQDKTGRMHGKIWDNIEKFEKKFKDDMVVNIEGRVNLYQGRNQIIVENCVEEENYNLEDFIISSASDPKIMFQELCEIMDSIQDDDVKKIWNTYKNDKDFMKKFKTCPAGKGNVHHAYIYGLLEHTLSVVKVCKFFGENYKDANRDIVMMGGFLHDLGKIDSYDYKATIKMTDVGRLHGHVTIGYHRFLSLMETLDIHSEKMEELEKVLGHIILSHHGSKENFAPVEPMTKEATLVAQADSADSGINHLSKILEVTVDNWSKYDTLKQKIYYEKKEIKEEVKEEKPVKKISRKKSSNKSTMYNYDKNV